MPRLLFLISVDSDPDRPEYGGARYDIPNQLTWRDLTKFTTSFSTLRKELLADNVDGLKITWFLRCDDQLRIVHGDAAWSLKKFEPAWKRLIEEGDEMAWHPHAWRWSKQAGCWYNELTDMEYIVKMYEDGFNLFRETMGFAPAATRAGMNYHTNKTIEKLDALGIRADLSAHPGLRVFYTRPQVGGYLKEGYDWERTGTVPYHPSLDV